MIILDYCLNFSIADLKQLGFFVPNSTKSGILKWNDSAARVRLTVDNTIKTVTLDYVVGEAGPVNYKIFIFETEANLGKGVVRFFNCPVTQTLCRKLYFNGYMFVSRKAIRGAIYRCQLRSKCQRTMDNGWAGEDFIPIKPYGKTHYRGRLTPYGKRIERFQAIQNHCENSAVYWLYRKLSHSK